MSTRRQRSATSRFTGTRLGRLMLAGPLVGLMSVPALAGPEGEQVVHGSAVFQHHGNHTVIRTSNRAIINYSGFDLASYESVRFIQAGGANARVLNRIQSGMPTFIDGSVTANGNVYFVNNAGIVFGNNAVFNVGGLFAAAGNISNRDFIAGKDHFTNMTGDVINNGHIEAGSVGLVGHRVANYGSIVAPEGLVTMAAGDDVYIGERNGHVFARVSSSADSSPNGGIEQGGSIVAREAMLSVGDHFALAVLDSSSIRAQRLTVRGGAEGSVVTVGGTIDATNETSQGGRVDIFGSQVTIDGAQIDASGRTGGGVIRVGGGMQGSGLNPTSDLTLVTHDALLRADALVSGQGGRVIVWGNDFTGFAGYISARGGAMNGNGGFVEVSGKEVLSYRGLTDLRATNGRAGTLLLDPRTINIVDGAASGPVTDFDFNDGAATETITDADLSAQLDLLAGGGELILQAARDINIQDLVSVATTEDGLLVLEAGRRIRMLGDATLDMGTGSLRLIANSDNYTDGGSFARGTGSADINMSAGSRILTNGGTIELLLQNLEGATSSIGNAANILISTIDAGDGLVRVSHTGVQGGGAHHVMQVTGGSGITAGSVEINSTTGGRVGVNNGSRLILDTDNLTIATAGGNTFLSLTGPTSITSIATAGGNIDLNSTDSVAFTGDADAGTGNALLSASAFTSAGGKVVADSVSLEATGGAIGASGAGISVVTDLLSASAQDGIFLETQSLGGGAMTVGSFDGLTGLTSATGTIELNNTGDLNLDRSLTATGHGLSEDVITISTNTISVTGTGGADAGATGGIVLNADSLAIDSDLGMSGREATLNIGAGGVAVTGSFGSAFEAVTITTPGTLAINAGGRLETAGSMTTQAGTYDITSGDGLNGDTALTIISPTGIDATAAFLGELESTGELTLRALGGDLTLGGQAAVFTTTTGVTLDATQLISFEGVEPTAYTFSALTATGGNGIEFSGEVLGLDVTGAGLLDGGDGVLTVLRQGVFMLTGGTLDLRNNLLAQSVGGGLVLGGTIDVSTGAGRYDILADTGGIVVNGTINTGGRNIQLATANGAIALNGLVDSNGVADGNIVVNIGAGSLTMAGGGTRFDAGDGAIALNANSWVFDGQFLDTINAATLTILSQVGDTVISGPNGVAPSIGLVQLRSTLGMVRLEGAGTYLFDSVTLDGETGIEIGAAVDALTATGAVTLDAQNGIVDIQNPGGFVLTSGAGGTVLNSDINAAGDLQFIGAVDATNSSGLPSPSGMNPLNLTVNGTLRLDNGLDAGVRNLVLQADDAVLGGILNAVEIQILSNEVSIGHNNGGFWLSNAFLDQTSATALRVGGVGVEASQVWIDGVSTIFNQTLTVDSVLVDAINNNSAFDKIALNVTDRILIDGVRLEVTGAGSDLRLAATNGILTTNGAVLAASGAGSRIDLHSDVIGTGLLTFDGDLHIDGGGTRLIVRDAGDTGTLRFVGSVDGAAGQALTIDASDGAISFGTGQVGQTGGFTSLDLIATGGVTADGDLNITADLTTLASSINTTGGMVEFNGGLLISGSRSIATDGGDVTVTGLTAIDGALDIDTTLGLGAGTVTFQDAIISVTPGAGDLLIDAGGGIVNFVGSIGRTGEDRHLNLLAVNAASTVNFGGSNYEATTLTFTADGFTVDRSGGGTTVFTSRSGDLTFAGGPLALTANTDLSIMAAEGGNVVLTDLAGDTADNDIVLTVRARDTVTFGTIGNPGQLLALVDVVVGDDVMPGHAVFTGSAFSDRYIIHADEIDFLGGFGSINGRDMTITQRDLDRGINIGGDGSDATRLNLTKDDIDALADGFEVIRIGDADTNDIMVIDNPGDVPLDIRDLFELRSANVVSVLTNIEGTGNAALSLFSGSATLLAGDITLDGGDLFVGDLAGGPGQVVIRETVNLLTNGGGVSMAGAVDGAGVTEDRLFIDAGDGSVVLGTVGASAALTQLEVLGGPIQIGGIGADGQIGVEETTLVQSDDELTFTGGLYNTNEARYSARRGMMATGDIEFLSNDNALSFGSTAQRGRGSIEFANNSTWTANAGTGELGLDGTYEGTNVDMLLTAVRVMLNGNATFLNPNGLVEFDAPLVGRRNLTMTMPSGDVRFMRSVGSDTDSSIRLRDINIAARRIDFLGSRVDADSARFAATRYGIDPQGVPPIQTFKMANGDLVFDGGLLLFSRGQLDLNAQRGALEIAEIRGGENAVQIIAVGRDGVTMFGIGSGNNSGVDTLLLQGNDIDVRGNMFVRSRTLLRPFDDGTAIAVGSPLVLGNGVLEITEAMLDRFVSTRVGSSLSVGGISILADLESSLNPGLFSNSQITINDISIGRQISFFGSDIELATGTTLTMTGGAPVRLSSVGTSRLDGSIISQGGTVVVNGEQSILNGLIATNGGDIIIRSENAFVDAGVDLNTLGGPNDGDFIVDGGIDGLVDGVGDFILNVGRGDIVLASGRGFGQTRRLRSVDLTANRLDLTNVFTTGNQSFTGMDRLTLSGGDLDSTNGDIRFNNIVTLAGEQFVGVGSGGTIFVDHNIVGDTTKADRFLVLDALPGGTVEFRGDTSGIDGLIVDADAVMFGDRIFGGGEIRFLGLVDAGLGKTALEINAETVAELVTDVGTSGAFSTMMVSAGDEIVLGQSGRAMRIETSSLQEFDGHTRIAGDVFLQVLGTESGITRQDSILFLGDVNGTTAGGDSLTAIVDRSFGEALDLRTPPTNVPIIGFNGDVGSSTRLGTLNLNFVDGLIDGRINESGDAFASVVATIVFGDVDAFMASGSTDYTADVRVDEINMGRGEAMTVIGSLDLESMRGRLSDVSTLNRMDMAFTQSLTVVNRVQGKTFDPTTKQFTDDEGTDFVAGGGIRISIGGADFSIDDEGIDAPGKISLAAIGADVNFHVPSAFASRVQLRSLPSSADSLYIFDMNQAGGAGGALLSDRFVVLDVRSAGPSNTNIAEAIAGASVNADSGQVEAGTVVEATIRDILRELGLEPRGYAIDYLDNDTARAEVTETMLGSLDGAGLFVDVANIDGRGGIETTIERLDRNVTTQVVTEYLLLWYGPRDEKGQLLPPTGEATDNLVPYDRSVDQTEVILAAFEKVTEDCRVWLETNDPATAELREIPAAVWMNFLIERADQYPAAGQYVIELERLMAGLKEMGLSQDELRRVWSDRLELVIPRGLDRDGMRGLLSGEQVLQMATDEENNGLEPVIDLE